MSAAGATRRRERLRRCCLPGLAWGRRGGMLVSPSRPPGLTWAPVSVGTGTRSAYHEPNAGNGSYHDKTCPMLEAPLTRTRAQPLMRVPRRVSPLFFVLSLLVCAASVSAQQPKASEAEVEAVYIFKFSQFITWPGNARSAPTFDICILGDDPLGPFLDRTVRGERVNGKAVVDRHLA